MPVDNDSIWWRADISLLFWCLFVIGLILALFRVIQSVLWLSIWFYFLIVLLLIIMFTVVGFKTNSSFSVLLADYGQTLVWPMGRLEITAFESDRKALVDWL